jgi:WD40 repeat protein
MFNQSSFNPKASAYQTRSRSSLNSLTPIEEAHEADAFTQTSDLTSDTANLLFDRRSLIPEFAFATIDYDSMPATQYKDAFTSPNTFHEAWNHSCPWQQKKWRLAVTKEVGKMNTLKVWELVKRASIPADRKCIKRKWIFEIKRDGTFKARLVACGYSQVPGVDFQES